MLPTDRSDVRPTYALSFRPTLMVVAPLILKRWTLNGTTLLDRAYDHSYTITQVTQTHLTVTHFIAVYFIALCLSTRYNITSRRYKT